MEPSDVTAAVQALAADDSASANSNLGAPVAECPNPIVNVGIFFDGTSNNANDPARRITNVWRLHNHYKDDRDDIRVPGGTCVQEAFRRRYIEGIGSNGSGFDEAVSGTSGYGGDGLFGKLEEATNHLREIVNSFGGFDRIEELRVDIFGFSRGAATTRIFANALATAGIGKLRIRFLGLFDTVGSFGMPGDDDEGYVERPRSTAGNVGLFLSPTLYAVFNQGELDLDIHANTTEKAFHITAGDEFRAFFPLSKITPPRSGNRVEVSCPGNHGDIGGGERAFVVTEDYSNNDVNSWAFLRARGWFDTAERTYSQGRRDTTRASGYRRTVQPGIIYCTLKAMHTQALQATVPMHPLSSVRAGDNITIPFPLAALAAALSAGQTPPETVQRPARATYAHQSWGGLGPNMLDINHVREEYPNQP